jgi:hypothetical protein
MLENLPIFCIFMGERGTVVTIVATARPQSGYYGFFV